MFLPFKSTQMHESNESRLILGINSENPQNHKKLNNNTKKKIKIKQMNRVGSNYDINSDTDGVFFV